MRILVCALCSLLYATTARAAVQASSDKQLYHVTGSKASFDALLASPVRQQAQLDIWRIRRSGGEHEEDAVSKQSKLVADIYAKHEDIQKVMTPTFDVHFQQGFVKGTLHKTTKWKFAVKKNLMSDDLDKAVAKDRRQVAKCRNKTEGYMQELELASLETYTESKFFDCFRPYDEVFAFFDALVKANPTIISKIPKVSTTYEGRSIDAYKISRPSASRLLQEQQSKKTLYTQALMHAREWQGGAATFYIMASFVDGLRARDPKIVEIFDAFDWIFVPIVNIDGYEYSWTTDRYWRVNRDPTSHNFSGVDLNRNFGPYEYFNLEPNSIDAETNPGNAAYSEPETKGILEFIKTVKNLSGMIDMHTFGGMVLSPFSDVLVRPEEPFGSAVGKLSDNVAAVMHYTSEPGSYLYTAYGCFDDGMYRLFNYTVPAITIEVEGDDFISPQRTIRDVGKNNLNGFVQFAAETTTYAKAIADQNP